MYSKTKTKIERRVKETITTVETVYEKGETYVETNDSIEDKITDIENMDIPNSEKIAYLKALRAQIVEIKNDYKENIEEKQNKEIDELKDVEKEVLSDAENMEKAYDAMNEIKNNNNIDLSLLESAKNESQNDAQAAFEFSKEIKDELNLKKQQIDKQIRDMRLNSLR